MMKLKAEAINEEKMRNCETDLAVCGRLTFASASIVGDSKGRHTSMHGFGMRLMCLECHFDVVQRLEVASFLQSRPIALRWLCQLPQLLRQLLTLPTHDWRHYASK